MLEVRPNCENCGKALPNTSNEAMICSFECTYCSTCVEEVLFNVCPNCGGGFEKRPTRPKNSLKKYPTGTVRVYEPIRQEDFEKVLNKYKTIPPRER